PPDGRNRSSGRRSGARRCQDRGRRLEGRDQLQGAGAGQSEEPVHRGANGRGLGRLEVAGLEEPGGVALDGGEGEERAERRQAGRIAAPGSSGELLEEDALDVSAGQVQCVILTLVECEKRVHPVVDAGFQATRERGQESLLAVLEGGELDVGVAQVVLVGAPCRDRVALGHGCRRATGEVAHDAEWTQLAELCAVAAEQRARNELVQHGIGALEGGEYVCIGAEGGQPVLCHVALAAAYLPCVLNRGYGVVGCVCLEACGERLDLARRVFVLDREATRQLLERELDRVCRCKRREEAPLHGEVVQDRHLGLTLRPELTPLRGVANADGERRL